MYHTSNNASHCLSIWCIIYHNYPYITQCCIACYALHMNESIVKIIICFFFHQQLQLRKVSLRDLEKSHCPCFSFLIFWNWKLKSVLSFWIQQQVTPCIYYICNGHEVYYDHNEIYFHIVNINWSTAMFVLCTFHYKFQLRWKCQYLSIVSSFHLQICFLSRLYFRWQDLRDRRNAWSQLLDLGMCGRHLASDKGYKQHM